MTESVTLIAWLNERWRILRIAGRPGWGSPCWLVENLDDDRAGAVLQVSATVREFVKARAGTISAEAAEILAKLPKRSDIGGVRPPPRKRLKAAEKRAAAAAAEAAATGKRAAVAKSFMSWRAQQGQASK
jgi:hypothetical protein